MVELRDFEQRAYELFLENLVRGTTGSAKVRRPGQFAVCFFGDGTTNIGAFHEALTLAVVWKLPVVFVGENNGYMEYTPIESVTAVKHPAADRAAAYGLEPILVDGNDADVMYETAQTTVGKARSGAGPSLVEALTYRHGGHSRADPGKYRPDAELREWLAKDPIKRYRERLVENRVPEAELEGIETRAQEKVDAATEEARNGPPAGVDAIERQVWSDGSARWRN